MRKYGIQLAQTNNNVNASNNLRVVHSQWEVSVELKRVKNTIRSLEYTIH